MKQTSTSGTLKVGKIAHQGYGYSSWNWDSPNNGKNSSFSSNLETLEALGVWAGSLVLRFSGLDDLPLYPDFCKLYIDDELIYVGKKGYTAGGGFFEYSAYPSASSYDLTEFFSESKIGTSYNIHLEFFDAL
ncbi:hypothetical protein RHO12_01635 [Orbus sturtevantii]|uniref:hypothetical protein n=1 Tax=Orbus sturtevantii TaxID=3074109 RepID=UPI00370D9D6E